MGQHAPASSHPGPASAGRSSAAPSLASLTGLNPGRRAGGPPASLRRLPINRGPPEFFLVQLWTVIATKSETSPMTVSEYLKADRQWPHHLRVARAGMKLKQSQSPSETEFWSAVLAANDKRVK